MDISPQKTPRRALPRAKYVDEGHLIAKVPQKKRLTDTLFSWEMTERKRQIPIPIFFGIVAILVIVILHALITDNPIVAITFILIGATGYLFLIREPKTSVFSLHMRGISANDSLYPFSTLESFWIFENEDDVFLSIHTDSPLSPYIRFPLKHTDIDHIRDVLRKHLSEKKHEERLIDTLEEFL